MCKSVSQPNILQQHGYDTEPITNKGEINISLANRVAEHWANTSSAVIFMAIALGAATRSMFSSAEQFVKSHSKIVHRAGAKYAGRAVAAASVFLKPWELHPAGNMFKWKTIHYAPGADDDSVSKTVNHKHTSKKGHKSIKNCEKQTLKRERK